MNRAYTIHFLPPKEKKHLNSLAVMSHAVRKIIQTVEKINVAFYHVSLRALNNFLFMQAAYILGMWTTFQAAQWQVIFNSVVVEKALRLK